MSYSNDKYNLLENVLGMCVGGGGLQWPLSIDMPKKITGKQIEFSFTKEISDNKKKKNRKQLII